MLDLLVKAGGDFVPMREHFSKPSDIKKSLAPAIQSLIETGSGKGYRLALYQLRRIPGAKTPEAPHPRRS
jgi:hypothetical protein